MTQKKEPFYLTTAIAYTSGRPHIGNTYEIILSDAIARFKRAQGYDVFFQTGTDEHGVKIEEKAKAAGVSPQEFVDGVAAQIKSNWDLMNTSYDYFVRTTDDYHVKEVQSIFKRLYDQGDIYKGTYEGWYCTPCESFWTESQLVDGCCPDCGRPVKKAKEEAYFFNMQKYADRLIKYIEDHPDFIQPESRKNEMLNNFLRPGLQDLCVSRTSFTWGVPVDFDPKHVVYVWIDALSNYITTLGYHANGESDEKFNKYWPATHIIGKDILRFHTIYWPIMLMALDIPIRFKLYVHGWILTKDGKMSKSKGNAVYPMDLIDRFGIDAVRYYLAKELPLGNDGLFSYERFIERYNFELANDLGNLVSRSISMINKYCDGVVPNKDIVKSGEYEQSLCEVANKAITKTIACFDKFRIQDGIGETWQLIKRANKYIDETAPWVLAKDDNKREELASVMYHLAESLRIIAILIAPYLVETSNKILLSLGKANTSMRLDQLVFGEEFSTDKVFLEEKLFQRLDMEKELNYFREQAKLKQFQKKEEVAKINMDDFSKISMVIGEIIECKKHPNADKLLVSQIKIGNEIKQIVSGIAQFYSPDELIGKKVVVVQNLESSMIRGVESSGMILCASSDNKLEVLEVKEIPSGAIVR